MEHFLDTEKTIGKGLGFALFGEVHIAWLVVCFVSIVAACLHYRHLSDRGRGIWRKIFAVALIANEVFKQVCLFVGGTFTLNYLPLHLCNINIFIIALHAWKPNKLLGNYLYTVCIPAALAALLFPGWEKLPVMNFLHLHSFTIHIMLMLYPIVLRANDDIKPDVKDIPKCLMMLLALASVVYCINLVLNTNYFYLMKAPKGNPLYWFQQAWGDHRLGFPVLIAAVLAVMYLPDRIYQYFKDRRRGQMRI